MRHVIQKQQFILFIPPEMDAFQVQHAASRLLRERLLPLLEQIFDELSGDGEVIHLDHFSIDLGVIGEAALLKGIIDETIYRLMKAEVRKAIEKELAERPAARAGTRESVFSRWWYYMEHGQLPWNADRLTEEDFWQVLELFSVDYAAISRLRTTLRQDPIFGMRIVSQHTTRFLENIVAALTSSRQEGIGEMVAQASRVHRRLEIEYRRVSADGDRGESDPLISNLRDWAARMPGFLKAPDHEKTAILWRRLLGVAAERPAEFAAMGASDVLLRDIPIVLPLLEIVLADEEVAALATPFLGALRHERDVLRFDSPGAGPKKTRRKKSPEAPTADKVLPAGAEDQTPLPVGGRGEPENKEEKPLEDGRAAAEPGTIRDAEDHRRDPELPASERVLGDDEVIFKQEDIDEEGIYLPNAGLILVHPFLSTLFHRAGLWDGGGFRDLGSRQKAILLLHFLATGDRHPPEYALVFPKMICGYAVDMPIPGELEPDEEQCAEGLVMLENVVLRWEKLGNSSVDGLREAFLQREGKLFNRGGRLVLRMETSGIDVLLDYLPWSIGLVKMPWLKDLLYVEWR